MIASTQFLDFGIDPNAIKLIIEHQSDSWQDAIKELIMNCADAGAKNCFITITKEGFSIIDDGNGFRSEDDVRRLFGVFGTPHEEGDARFGRFRMGRGKIMALASTTWNSNEFSMEVDIKKNGYKYGLSVVETKTNGCNIKGLWYPQKRNNFNPVQDCNKEYVIDGFRKTLGFIDMKVLINGKDIKHIDRKWTIQTPEANIYIDVKQLGHGYVTIFNLGIPVETEENISKTVIDHIEIVTKLHLTMNMSRSQVMPGCHVLTKILDSIDEYYIKEWESGRLTSARENFTVLLTRLYEKFPEKIWSAPLIKVASRKSVSLEDIADHAQNQRRFCQAYWGQGTQAEAIMKSHPDIMVFAYEMMNLTVGSAKENIVKWAIRMVENEGYPSPSETFVDFNNLPENKQKDKLLQQSDLSTELARRWRAVRSPIQKLIRAGQYILARIDCTYSQDGFSDETLDRGYILPKDVDDFLEEARDGVKPYSKFTLCIGQSEHSGGWTDGKSFIAIDKDCLKHIDSGRRGIGFLCSLITHELSHSGGGACDEHTEEFFQRFHDLTMNPMYQQELAECERGIVLNYYRIMSKEARSQMPIFYEKAAKQYVNVSNDKRDIKNVCKILGESIGEIILSNNIYPDVKNDILSVAKLLAHPSKSKDAYDLINKIRLRYSKWGNDINSSTSAAHLLSYIVTTIKKDWEPDLEYSTQWLIDTYSNATK